jgi:HlyD family secretion protein
MATPPNSPKPDLSALRIGEGQRKSGSTGKRLGIAVVCLLIVAAITVTAFAFRTQKPVVEVAIAQKAEAGGRAALLNASGYVTPRRRATLAAKITGRVTAIYFDEGTRVRERQLLATLDDSDARRALEAAKADRNASQAAITDFEVQLRNAEIVLRRAQDLQKAGVQTQEALDNARTAVESLRAKIELAKQQVNSAEARINEAQQGVDNCVIRAPFEGIVVSKDAQVGEMVVDVNEAYIARVSPAQQVTAILDAYPDWEIPSKVRTVIPTADRQKATVKVRISFLKLDPRILPDMGIKVTFLGDERNKQKGAAAPVALVPQDAVRDDNGQKIVFLVKEEHLERRAITAGGKHGSDTEVMAGLAAGDRVVVKGPEGLRDGQAIEIKK